MVASQQYQTHELQQALKQVQQQLQMLAQQREELDQVHDSVVEMKSVDKGQEILVPLGAGIFTQGTLTQTKTLLLNVGAQVVVEKNVDDALTLIEKQMKELQTIEQSMQEEFGHISQQLQFMQLGKGLEGSEE